MKYVVDGENVKAQLHGDVGDRLAPGDADCMLRGQLAKLKLEDKVRGTKAEGFVKDILYRPPPKTQQLLANYSTDTEITSALNTIKMPNEGTYILDVSTDSEKYPFDKVHNPLFDHATFYEMTDHVWNNATTYIEIPHGKKTTYQEGQILEEDNFPETAKITRKTIEVSAEALDSYLTMRSDELKDASRILIAAEKRRKSATGGWASVPSPG